MPITTTTDAKDGKQSSFHALADPPSPPRMMIVGIDIPFPDMVAFCVKALFAAVPAGLVAVVIYWIVRTIIANNH